MSLNLPLSRDVARLTWQRMRRINDIDARCQRAIAQGRGVTLSLREASVLVTWMTTAKRLAARVAPPRGRPRGFRISLYRRAQRILQELDRRATGLPPEV